MLSYSSRHSRVTNCTAFRRGNREAGQLRIPYFDDRHWTIRYLVADTGNWLSDRQVLISPYALGAVNKEEQHIAIDLTKKQIEDSPSLNSDKPVSRQFEEGYYRVLWMADVLERAIRVGALLPTPCVTVKNEENLPKLRKRGIPICAALTM